MGKLRTINHPGIETQEIDMSGSTDQVGGCTTLVMGFFPQGESGKPVHPTTSAAVKSYFGTPETEAERYSYYACKTVFDNGGNLVAARIPYNNNSQYLTPATKYKIEEWSTKNIKEYGAPVESSRKITNTQRAIYSETELDGSTSPSKSEFFYRDGNFNNIGMYERTIHGSKTYGDSEETTFNVTAISSTGNVGSMNEYYELTFNKFETVCSYSFDGEEFTVSATVLDFDTGNTSISGTVENYSDLDELDEEVAPEGAIYEVSNSFSITDEGHYLSGDFAANSCFERLKVLGAGTNPIYITNSAEALEQAKNWAENEGFDAVVYAGDYGVDGAGDPDGHNVPYDTVIGYDSEGGTVNSYLPQTFIIIEDDEGIERTVVSYKSANGVDRINEDITDGRIMKVLNPTNDYSNGFGNYVATLNGSENTITWTSLDNTDGFFVFDRAIGDWRRIWDYYDDFDLQWSYTIVNKYSEFTYEVSDSLTNGEGGFNPENTLNDTNVWVNDAGTYMGQSVTSTLSASLDGKLHFKTEFSNGDLLWEFDLTPLFHHSNIDLDTDIEFLTEENSRYFNIEKKEFDKWESNTGETYGSYFYTETICSENKSDFYYDPTVSSPVTGFIDSYTDSAHGGLVKVIGIKSYYKSGEGTQYPEFDSNDYLELRIWNENKIKDITDVNKSNSDYFDIIRREYKGELVKNVYKIAKRDFKCVPLTSDVTVGYYPSTGVVNSDTLAIPAADKGDYDESKYPVIEDANPFGTGWMKVLTKINPTNSTVVYKEDDFYQLVSPYTRVEDIALAHSEKYKWIHWYIPKNDSEDVSEDKRILLSRTLGCEIKDVPLQLSEVENVVTILPDPDYRGFIPLNEFQDYRDEAKKPDENTIIIANITEQKFGSDMYNNAVVTDGESTAYDYSDEVLGIVPVLIGGFQALPRQSRIELPDGITNGRIFNALEAIKRGSSIENDPAPESDHVDIKAVTLNENGFVRTLGATGEYDAYESTYSNQMISCVPSIDLNANYKPNGAKMNYVTLAVCQLALSKVNDNKISMTVLETFTGSLDRTAKDDNGKSLFIDNIVNNEDNGSTYVRLFSNYKTTLTGQTSITESVREVTSPASNDTKVTLTVPTSVGTKLWWTKAKPSMSLGFTNEQTKKYISYATIVATMENVFDSLSNVDEIDLDLVMDAGLSTIANRIKKYCDDNPEETKTTYDVFYDKISSVEDVAGWKSICSKLTTFCQTTRKDCITLLDAPRSLCVKDNVKLVSPGSKYSVDYDILPKFNYIGGMNSSYAAGYCDWMLAVDDFTSKNVWLPPSIAAEGAVIYTDYNSNYWMPPAGQNRGNVTWAVDIAFNPNAQQQDSIYSKGWNYAISSSGNIMVWGQKTMLNSTSSFNRINIRRLFCRLERLTRKNSKWVIFEINNRRTRDIYKDRIDPIFSNVKAMGGIYDYQIICDERNNTPQVIMQNEFRSAFLIKPEYAAEYIILTFFNMNQDMDFSEAYSEL